MTTIDYTNKVIHARVLYVGPMNSGKGTNLDFLYLKTGSRQTEDLPGHDYWELNGLELTLGDVHGFKPILHLFPVIGAPFYGSSRKLFFGTPGPNSVAGLIWVADSQPSRQEANEIIFEFIRTELAEQGLNADTIPSVIQFSKRDLPDALAIEDLSMRFNPKKLPEFPAIPTKGIGVFETFKALSKIVLMQLHEG